MLDEEHEDGDIEVRILREALKIDNVYVDPVVEDIHAVPVTSVKVPIQLVLIANMSYPPAE